MKEYDCIVIGAGGGSKIAIPAAARGLKTAFIEKGPLGGTCLNRGCIPSKILIHPADVVCSLQHLNQLNLSVQTQPEVDFSGLIDRVQQDVREIVDYLDRTQPQKEHLEVLRGHARFKADHIIEVHGEELTAPRIFIATGSRPWIPAIPGLADTPFMTSTEALQHRQQPESMAILGAGYIACELGHAYGSLGTDVHFIVRSRLLRQEDREIQQEFERVFGNHHTLHQPCTLTRVHHDGKQFHLSLSKDGVEQAPLITDALLVATGVEPCTNDLGLEHTSIERHADGTICVNEYLETHVDGVWALGDCVGHFLFRHSVNREGEYLERQVFENEARRPILYGAMPHAIFTYPQIAGAGATEAELLDDHVDFVTGRRAYNETSMGLARRSEFGFVKLLVDRFSHKLLGAHILGDEAATMMHTVIALMYKNGTLEDLLEMVYIHPALPEVIRDAARDARSQL